MLRNISGHQDVWLYAVLFTHFTTC